MVHDVDRALADLLLRERADILAGRLEGLERLHDEKMALLARLPGAAPQRAGLMRIRQLSEENQRLLAAAAEGLKSAAARLAAISGAQAGFGTYDRSGRESRIEIPRRVVERKA